MTYFARMIKYYENKAKVETLNQLRRMPERQLVDLGFSPLLISKGVKGWPWKESAESLAPLQLDQSAAIEKLVVTGEQAVNASNSTEVAQQNAA